MKNNRSILIFYTDPPKQKVEVAPKSRQGYKPNLKQECDCRKHKLKAVTSCVVCIFINTMSWNKTVNNEDNGKEPKVCWIPTKCCLSLAFFESL